ncbi:putative secreted protein (Por secretion system target) [Lutibacter sp. Hel_I_33_5]|uniref:T9SS type A sorting domain-containing protein n=1 Tax=Lutibacter sp. Hel_I_33_5 TaxID=1566289 RepID=UPI0011A143E7|nr:T9SS type A sorting domain-containing protein [Lutibacter sp. Hel_I_33_5]TVZ56959.1 putative secreted protein (Por secretion system target) [Lutibacter sp. Hel_I_33_5]
MKKNHILLIVAILCHYFTQSQTRGSIAFTAINVDGDDDFAIVTLADIAPNTTIYFTDYEWDEAALPNPKFTETGSDGFLSWNSGTSIIKAGAIITFNDIDNSSNTHYGSSIGTLTSLENINLLASGETLFAYIGTDKDNPTLFLTGIKNGAVTTDLTGTGLGGTDLAIGNDFLEFNPVTSPDGGFFSGSRSNQVNPYSNYLSILVDKNNWTHNTGLGEDTLPISREAFTTSATTWDGSTSSVWNLADNWSNGIPTSSSLVTIPDVTTSPIINSGTTANAGNLTIESGELLTINTTNSLSINGKLAIIGNLSIKSGGSLIIHGTSTGEVTYNVSVNDTNWHLVSSPVTGEQYDDSWVSTNSINTTGTNNNNAIGIYDNTTDANGNWNYFQTGGIATTFNQGQGYSLKRTGIGEYSFTGTIPTTNIKKVITTAQEGLSGENKWNLVGNPFPAYLNIETFLSENATPLNNSHEAVYVWDGMKYQALTSGYIHTGQGFFVNSNAVSTNVAFNKTQLSHQTGITFYRNNTEKIILSMTDGSKICTTEIKYDKNTTTGLDPRFDIGTFTGEKTIFNLYTRLVDNSNDINFMQQTLPKNYENQIIPIGINADKGKQLTFSANIANVPNSINVYLEDKVENIFTNLNNVNTTYQTNISEKINGIGRFYLHTTSQILDISNYDERNVNIFISKTKNITIAGLKRGNATIKLYNLLGKLVFQSDFKANDINNFKLPGLKTAIYLAYLITENGKLTTKVIIKN